MDTGSGDNPKPVSSGKKLSSKSEKIQYEQLDGVTDGRGNQGELSNDVVDNPLSPLPPSGGKCVTEVKVPVVDCEAVIKKHLAAIKIQSHFRSWLVRTNMRMVTKCVIKIQAIWRGALVRMHRKRLSVEAETTRKSVRVQNPRHSRSPSRKSHWKKVHPARMTELNRKQKIGGNNALEGSTEGRNYDATVDKGDKEDLRFSADSGRGDLAGSSHPSLDSLCPSNDGDAELRMRMERALQCLETILKDVCGEDLTRVSKTRVAELVEYLDKNPTATTDDVCLANSLARMCPTVSSGDTSAGGEGGGLIKSDPDKVQLLKDAIRLYRQRIHAWENRKLYPYHHLARTSVIPGIFSDPFSGELTEVEKKLIDIRFERKGADSYVSPAKFKTENTKQLKELIELNPDEKDTLEKIYNFKFNHFPEQAANIETKKKNGVMIQVPKPPPPFTTLFKANPKRRL